MDDDLTPRSIAPPSAPVAGHLCPSVSAAQDAAGGKRAASPSTRLNNFVAPLLLASIPKRAREKISQSAAAVHDALVSMDRPSRYAPAIGDRVVLLQSIADTIVQWHCPPIGMILHPNSTDAAGDIKPTSA